MRKTSLRKGSAVSEVLVFAAVIIFVILPIFSFILEKYVLLNKAQIIKDAVDMTNISVYNAMNAERLSMADVDMDSGRAVEVYRYLLALNLKLDEELRPCEGSIAEAAVYLKSLVIMTGALPDVCPEGINITRPSVHSTVVIPVKPSLYRQMLLSMLGKQFIELEVHVDSEIPVNN